MGKYATIDTTAFPLITISFSAFEPTLNEFKAYLREMEEMYTLEGSMVIIFDASRTKYLSSELRIEQGKWLKAHKELIKSKVPLMVFVIPNPLVQMVFKGILRAEPLPAPYKIASNLQEAHKLALEALSQSTMAS